MIPLPFAALVLEREPPTWKTFPTVFESYVQVVGGIAFIVLLLVLVVTAFRPLRVPKAKGSAAHTLLFLSFVLACVAYLCLGVLWAPSFVANLGTFFSGDSTRYYSIPPSAVRWERLFLTIGGAAALIAVGIPFVLNLPALRFRRIWAIALLTIKEVIRRRILWVFALLALLFLFAAWFINPKPETQLESYVQVVYPAMSLLVLLTASLLAAFTIPTDIRQLTIHTVVTKPVEKFEIVLGRFLGHTVVMTGALLVMTTASAAYVLREVSPEAKAETMKARVPITGELEFENTPDKTRGISVGEEWDYRSYISGPTPGQKTQYAIWSFDNVSPGLASRDKVSCEFTFFIYRTTIGQINKGVDCTFAVETWRWHRGREGQYDAERRRLRQQHPEWSQKEIDNRLGEKYGFYRLESKEVVNYHTQVIDLPIGLIRNQLASRSESAGQMERLKQARRIADIVARQKAGGLSPDDQQAWADWRKQNDRLTQLQDKAKLKIINADEEQERAKLEAEVPSGEFTEADEYELRVLQEDAKGAARPPLRVRVNCVSRTQFLGMAKYDLYLLDVERPFVLNFYKGVIGIWFWLCMVIGVAVAISTYCSGPITILCVGFLAGSGLLLDPVQKIAAGVNEGGGPGESLVRLLGRQTLNAPLEETTTTKVVSGGDVAFRLGLKPVLYVIPDPSLYDFKELVGSGFDVPMWQLGLMFVYLLGYLLPWAVLAFYIIRVREIATW